MYNYGHGVSQWHFCTGSEMSPAWFLGPNCLGSDVSIQFSSSRSLSASSRFRGSKSASRPILAPHTSAHSYGASLRLPKHIKRLIYAQCTLLMPLPHVQWYTTRSRGRGWVGRVTEYSRPSSTLLKSPGRRPAHAKLTLPTSVSK